METIKYRPVLDNEYLFGVIDERTCKRLYLAGRITDTWDIEILISDRERVEIITEKPSTLFNK